jgi:hypothetical protein
MDDGDDRYYREKKPTDGAPTYVKNPEGLKDIPYNEHFRIRTRTGHQLLFHNSEDLIYIGNSRGTAWIEFTSDGKIDIYAEDSINIRTKQDFNFVADRDFNIEVGRNFNLKVNGEMQVETGTDYNVIVGTNGKITVGGTMDLNVTGSYKETAVEIHMNGPVATKALRLKTHSLPDLPAPNEDDVDKKVIVRRMPTAEPYPFHENLDATKVKPNLTDRDVDGRYEGESSSMRTPPGDWRKYKKPSDTPF